MKFRATHSKTRLLAIGMIHFCIFILFLEHHWRAEFMEDRKTPVFMFNFRIHLIFWLIQRTLYCLVSRNKMNRNRSSTLVSQPQLTFMYPHILCFLVSPCLLGIKSHLSVKFAITSICKSVNVGIRMSAI